MRASWTSRVSYEPTFTTLSSSTVTSSNGSTGSPFGRSLLPPTVLIVKGVRFYAFLKEVL
jgi:hypothetical protein